MSKLNGFSLKEQFEISKLFEIEEKLFGCPPVFQLFIRILVRVTHTFAESDTLHKTQGL